MAELKWNEAGKKYFETGVEKTALFVMAADGTYNVGVAWSGMISVEESPSGAEPTALYADNQKYLELTSKEEFGATIEAYQYPDEFKPCMGQKELVTGAWVAQQGRSAFGLAYMTNIGNDTEGSSKGKKLHLVYGAKAAPASKSYESEGETPNAMTMSWDITTTGVEVDTMENSAHIIVDSTLVDAAKWDALILKVYGGAGVGEDPTLILPADLKTLLATG